MPEKPCLRLITCGSVDDGKSTLIGRLLYETRSLHSDQLKALEQDSKKSKSNTAGSIDYSLLLDGLEAEREQAITIDVAYRGFETTKKKYIVADTPGHEQYTRNMVTGASTAELAVLLIDATKGVKAQTKRHAYICSLMGIKHFVVAVNKMDKVDFKEDVFLEIKKDFERLLGSLLSAHARRTQFIPLSALEGDNLVSKSERMPWFNEVESLLGYLDALDLGLARSSGRPLRFQIQLINRSESGQRGYCGSLASGTLQPGDEVRIVPSGHCTSISKIRKGEKVLDFAQAGESVCLELDKDVDLSRGDYLVAKESPVIVAQLFDARLVWMDLKPLEFNKSYILKMGTKSTKAQVTELHHQVDVNTLSRFTSRKVELNGIALCRISSEEPLLIDSYKDFPASGSAVLIDPDSYSTVAAVMLEGRAHEHSFESVQNTAVSEVFWNHGVISSKLRAVQKKQKARCLWFTGLSGAGKSTIANRLDQELYKLGYHSMLLDGDNLRHGLCRDLGMGLEDRSENIRRAAEVAKLMTDAGLVVLGAFISPFKKDRDFVRSLFAKEAFVEIYVNTPLELCEDRDVKGLYKKARQGLLKDFTGIDSPFEEPQKPELVLSTTKESVDALVKRIITELDF